MSIRIEQTNIEVEDWIDGATYTQVKVDIHRNRALYAEIKPLYEQLEQAEARLAAATAAARAQRDTTDESSLGQNDPSVPVTDGEDSLSDTPAPVATVAAAQAALDEIAAQAQVVYDRYDADKETWTIRRLEPEEVREIVAAHEMPALPRKVGSGANKAAMARFAQRVQEFNAAVKVVKDAVDEECLALAVVSVNVAGVDKPAPSLDGIRRLRKRPHGEEDFRELVDGLESITLQEVAIPAPHRRGA